MDEVFSTPQAELTGIAHCLEKALKILDMHPERKRSRALIFCDAESTIHRLRFGIDGKESAKFHSAHTRPVVKAIVWMSHQLRARGCPVQLHWIPRKTTHPACLADELAGTWKYKPRTWWRPGGGYHTHQPGNMFAQLRDEVRAAVQPFVHAAAPVAPPRHRPIPKDPDARRAHKKSVRQSRLGGAQ